MIFPKKLSTGIKSKKTLFEYFQKNNFITASYSPYPRINPTYNFDKGVDVMKFVNQNDSEILDEVISHIEYFKETSNFIFAHLMDMHHLAKGFKEIYDFTNFPDKNYNYQDKLNKTSYSNTISKRNF